MARRTLKRKADAAGTVPQKSARLLEKTASYTAPPPLPRPKQEVDNAPSLLTNARSFNTPHQAEHSRPQLAVHSMPASTSTHRALGVTELLENILVYLPLNQILTCQRVCRQFQSVVSKSITIQDKLFLRVSQKDAEIWKRSPDGSCIRTKEAPGTETMEELQAGIENRLAFTRLNSFFLELHCDHFSGQNIAASTRLNAAMQQSLQDHTVPATLYRMHFTDCPIPRIQLRVYWTVRGNYKKLLIQVQTCQE